ncbi:DUF1893 domain-containing protein [Proteiniclasticum sp. SCR006]|uniref:DUF1893 domain-containing protein n=1 Tax=Proteiniclasticum aestuarii TaxID=2817862 RepID=A0A939HDX0_9CLOT|nr:DUF1893 domain-containing protein [Proteiniclasticum aestuarii]MBO1265508.1 DUF1893 domain-containing protein [Proteiniclasticum aestuarii]
MSDTMLRLLEEKEAACLIYSGETLLHHSQSIGVKPLLEFMEKYPEGYEKEDLLLIDKVIGKAALLLSVLLNMKTIHTPVASRAAVEAAKVHGVKLYAETVVPYILNREKNGMCPLEKSVLDTTDPKEALQNIREAIRILMAKKKDH